MELILERRSQLNETAVFGNGAIMVAPVVDEDYWEYRVRLSEMQAVVGFPKFSTIGIGFAFEEDWNTNLPYASDTDEIFGHIIDNKGDDRISDEDVRAAITLIQQAVKEDRP